MEDYNLLLSIIIPTKNRHNQLLDTLKAHNFWPENLKKQIEIVISDNSDSSIELNLLEEIKNIFPNVHYQNSRSFLTISDNFTLGLNISKGKWIVFIGDDDFFMPSIIQAIYTNEASNVDCMIYNPNKYYWKNCIFTNKNVAGGPGTLVLSNSWEQKKIDPKEELMRSLKNGGLTIEKMPRAYHGIIKRSVMKRCCLATSDEMLLGSPDVSIATILSCSNISVLSIPGSPTIYGASDGSGGGMTTSKTHVQTLDKASFLSKSFKIKWNETIPKYWSEYTVFPASILYVIEEYKLKQPAKLNHAAIYISCLFYEIQFFKDILLSFGSLNSKEVFNFLKMFPYTFIRKAGGLIVRRINKKRNTDVFYSIEPNEIIKYDF